MRQLVWPIPADRQETVLRIDLNWFNLFKNTFHLLGGAISCHNRVPKALQLYNCQAVRYTVLTESRSRIVETMASALDQWFSNFLVIVPPIFFPTSHVPQSIQNFFKRGPKYENVHLSKISGWFLFFFKISMVANVPPGNGQCTPRGKCTTGWEPLV